MKLSRKKSGLFFCLSALFNDWAAAFPVPPTPIWKWTLDIFPTCDQSGRNLNVFSITPLNVAWLPPFLHGRKQ